MTTINNIQDLIHLLRDQPHWADELRGILLSDELRDLPAAVRDLAQAVRDLAQAVRDSAEHTGQRLATVESLAEALPEKTQAVETKVDILQTQVNALSTKADTLTGHMNHLRGAEYERRAENRAVHRTQTQMGFLQPRTVMGPRYRLQPVFSPALARARADAGREQRPLPELTEQNNFLNADIIIADMGDPNPRERRSPPVAYAVFEASITAHGDDVQSAAHRARTLAQTMDVPVTPRSQPTARPSPSSGMRTPPA